MRLPLFLVLVCTILVCAISPVSVAGEQPRLVPPKPIVPGFAPAIEVHGLAQDDRVRLWTIRRFTRWEQREGRWVEVPVTLHAWAEYAPQAGRVDVRTTPSLRGTYRGVDAYGLLWSGRPAGDPLVVQAKAPAAVDVFGPPGQLVALVSGKEIGRVPLTRQDPEGLRIAAMREPGIAGVYAAPADGRKHPVMLLLHGSEGGNLEDARALAVRFAGQGYAAMSVIYFAWDLAKVEGVAHAHLNTPIELLDRARGWVAQQPEADAGRLGVYGHSKGAEFAEVAAVRYPWIQAVVACVPTDVVWEGHGYDDERNEPGHRGPAPALASSWSFGGEPLPYVKLRPYDWRRPDQYFSNTERYELSRMDDPERALRAAIPIERSRAKFLLIGGEKDEVWASGQMAKRLAARFDGLPGPRKPEVHVFEGAGHGICSDGTWPPRVYGHATSDPRSKDLDREGAAAARAWELTVDFLHRQLVHAGDTKKPEQ